MKCLYLALMSLDPTGTGRQRWTNRCWVGMGCGAGIAAGPFPRAARWARRAVDASGSPRFRPWGLASPRGGDRAADMAWHYPA